MLLLRLETQSVRLVRQRAPSCHFIRMRVGQSQTTSDRFTSPSQCVTRTNPAGRSSGQMKTTQLASRQQVRQRLTTTSCTLYLRTRSTSKLDFTFSWFQKSLKLNFVQTFYLPNSKWWLISHMLLLCTIRCESWKHEQMICRTPYFLCFNAYILIWMWYWSW